MKVDIVPTIARPLLLLAIVFSAPLLAQAQQPEKVYRVGILWNASVSEVTASPNSRALHDGLRELGYVEGRNLVLEHRYAEWKAERLGLLATELARLPLDVLIGAAGAASVAAKHATRSIPIVAVYVTDPVGEGLAATLSRPGGNVTGLSSLSEKYVAKMLEFLREVRPAARHVVVLGDPTAPTYAIYWRELSSVAPGLRMTLGPVSVRLAEDLETAFAQVKPSESTALLVLHQPLTFAHRQRIAALALKSQIPAVYGSPEYAEAGGLLGYGTNPAAVYRRAAAYVDKILRGAKPGDLPIEQPSKFDLVVNLRTARGLGLTIPPSLLLRADHVIE